MEDWIRALKNTSKPLMNQSSKELLNGYHDWFVCSHARPTFCNICREALNGVTSHGLSCEICKFKAHKRCASKAARNCKWTTLASIGNKEIIEDEDRNICMPHQWLEGNLPVNAKCSYCEKACGSVIRMQDFRCLWCKAYVHSHCKDNYIKNCNLGVCRVSILPPTHINTVASDGFVRASKAPNTSPLVVFVNSKSGDNQGIKFLRKFKQLLNPFQVFDLIQDGPVPGLRMFQKFDCFRVLVCGGDGSVGWVLKEIDSLNLHKQCQIGVVPLGTGNDLARVLGWGSALDDDNQLPKLLESFERATTKMLDRWSMMTYELPVSVNNINNNSNSKQINTSNNKKHETHKHDNDNKLKREQHSMISAQSSTDITKSSTNLQNITNDNNTTTTTTSNLNFLQYIWYHLNNILKNDDIDIVIESSQILNAKLNELLVQITEYNQMIVNESMKIKSSNNNNNNNKNNSQYMVNVTSSLISDKCMHLKHKLNDFFSLLKSELKTNVSSNNSINSNNSASFNNLSNSNDTSGVNTEIPDELLYSPSSNSSPCNSPLSDTSSDDSSSNKNSSNKNNNNLLQVSSNTNLSIQKSKSATSVSKQQHNFIEETNVYKNENNSSNNSIKRRIMLNSISKLFKHRRKVMNRANSLKKSIKQIIKLADTKIVDTNNLPKLKTKEDSFYDTNIININIRDCSSSNDVVNIEEIIKYKNVSYDEYEDDYVDNEDKIIVNNDESLMKNISQNKNNQRPKTLSLVSSHLNENEFNFLKINIDHEFNENFKKNMSIDTSAAINDTTIDSLDHINNAKELDGEKIENTNKEESCSTSNSGTNATNNNFDKSPSVLTINRALYSNGTITDVPLASEEQSCMSTPNTTNLSCSIDSIYKQQQQQQQKITTTATISRPNQLNLFEKNTLTDPNNDRAPQIRIICDNNEADPKTNEYESDFTRLESSRSPSFLGYITSTSSFSITPNSAYDLNVSNNNNNNNNKNNCLTTNTSTKLKQKLIPAPFLLPPSMSSLAIKYSSPNLNTSSSSNNLSIRNNDFRYLGVPLSPSGYSSSGSCYSKNTLPSPRISKKYTKEILSSTMHLQLPNNRGISALSSSFRRRSMSKSSDKSSSPTSPASSPKLVFKFNPATSPFSFVSQALLFNADALCAPIAAPVVSEPILDLYAEKAVMNNYFGIGLDAKLALEFHMTREEHPEKCRSRIRNHMLYGLLGSKEIVQRTCKNLEQKVLLECDGTQIPLKNVEGIVVLNIPSYTGGVNFWGHNSKDENIFTVPSYDDKILEVVAVSGCLQMALSRVVNIKSNRIAQCHTVKIQILGPEGVPVQVDGEAWIQQPGFIYLVHKNRAQMLTRNKVFEHTLKTWSEKQKNDPHLNVSLSKEEFNVLQSIIDDSITLIKRIKTASLRNVYIEQDLCGYAIQASSNLDEISINGKILEKSMRQQVTDFLNSIRTLHVETGLFINEKAAKLNIESETTEKIQKGLNDLKISMKKLNDCRGLFQFPIENDELSEDLEYKRKSRFGIVQRYKKSKIKHKDDKELLKTLHSIPIKDWGPDEVGLWLESLNLAEYKAAFIKHDIRGTEIRNLERRDLRELGIVKVGHLKRILNASKEIPKKVAIEKQSV